MAVMAPGPGGAWRHCRCIEPDLELARFFRCFNAGMQPRQLLR